jgi:ribosomal protein RSM22 (predicted rRNA methylase)
MTAPDLPAELRASLDAKLQGLSRRDAAGRAAIISQTYRAGGGSGAIRSETDALAYALARMPATYAAVTASLNALHEITPDFAPESLLDVGAGPGTATWAAAEAFSSLRSFGLLDANATLRALALDLASGSARLRGMTYQRGEARAALADAEPADLVVASYMIGEIDSAEQKALAAQMWAKTRDTLLIVEPGTPAGSARIIALREQLIASGAHVAAPCPHDGKCPLQPPDWCHFTQRLPRSRAHKQLKDAEVPFEDEKFAYVALTRAPAAARPARVLAQPDVTKVEVTAKLCTSRGLVITKVPRRAKADYARARRWRWGDAVMESQTLTPGRPGERRDP